MDTFVRSLLDLAWVLLITIFAWGKFTQKVNERLDNFKEWQKNHETEATDRDKQITELRIITAQQKESSIYVRETLERIEKKLDGRIR